MWDGTVDAESGVRTNRGDSIDAPGSSCADSTKHEVRQMATIAIGTIEELEALAAWHRANAEHAGSDWVWEARAANRRGSRTPSGRSPRPAVCG